MKPWVTAESAFADQRAHEAVRGALGTEVAPADSKTDDVLLSSSLPDLTSSWSLWRLRRQRALGTLVDTVSPVSAP